MSEDGEITSKGEIKDKLIKSKQAWAEEGRLITGNPDASREDRLPPGQRLVENWPVLDLGIQPQIPLESWELQIDGDVANPVTWNWEAFQVQTQVQTISDIHCVTAWSRYDNHWEGVSSAYVLDLVRPSENVNHVIYHSYDGYTTNATLERFAASDVLIAHSWEGAPLSREHGGPVRMIMPQWYLWKSAKWLKRIEFVNADAPGFWEVRGYHNSGDPWKEERYSAGPVEETVLGPDRGEE